MKGNEFPDFEFLTTAISSPKVSKVGNQATGGHCFLFLIPLKSGILRSFSRSWEIPGLENPFHPAGACLWYCGLSIATRPLLLKSGEPFASNGSTPNGQPFEQFGEVVHSLHRGLSHPGGQSEQMIMEIRARKYQADFPRTPREDDPPIDKRVYQNKEVGPQSDLKEK